MNIKIKKSTLLVDLETPVSIFQKLRYHYSNIALLESNDYHKKSESHSFIGFEPFVELILKNGNIQILQKGEVVYEKKVSHSHVLTEIDHFLSKFKLHGDTDHPGFLTLVGFEFSHYFESKVQTKDSPLHFPDFHLVLFQHLIAIDHFHNTGVIFELTHLEADFVKNCPSELLKKPVPESFIFELVGTETSKNTDQAFIDIVQKAKQACYDGDVFQLVVSKCFTQQFFGDEFEVYRSLRSLNPSPYLFFVDMENYRILGSSPEAQLKIASTNLVEIHPIAGTIKKTGDEREDYKSCEQLKADRKENAEHTMLVDLARNDLSKHCTSVRVSSYKEIQSFSHVIHLVSKVVGLKKSESSSIQLFVDTFPAGTLSGTPKPKALELISSFEKEKRDFYGGSLGILGFDGSLNMAIIIRSIYSQENKLYYRAGAGVVIHSNPQSELHEIHSKLGAIRLALNKAHEKGEIQKEQLFKDTCEKLV